MNRSRISVVIPTRNGARTLAACLESLRASSFPPTEIIVVDDASSDGLAEIARQFHCRVVRVDENIGAARARRKETSATTLLHAQKWWYTQHGHNFSFCNRPN